MKRAIDLIAIACAAALWMLMLLAIYMGVAGATPPPRPGDTLRSISQAVNAEADARDADGQRLIDLYEKVGRLEAEIARQSGNVYVPGQPIEEGKTYYVEAGTPLAEVINTPNVTFKGAGFPTNKHAFDVRADDVKVVGFVFDTGRPGVKKLGVGACVRTVAARTSVIGCRGYHVDSFVVAGIGASGLRVEDCETSHDLRSHFVYGAGVDGATILRCTAPNSQRENLVRFTREGKNPETAISRNVLIADCKFGNSGKAVIDIRQVRGAVVTRNQLTSDEGGTAVRVGPHQSRGLDAALPWEVADDVTIDRNEIWRGAVQVYPGGTNVTIQNNVGRGFRGKHKLPNGKTFNGESAFTVSGYRDFIPEARLKNVALLGNVMHLAVGEPNPAEPAALVTGADKIEGLVLRGNVTVPVTGPATQPTTRPVQ